MALAAEAVVCTIHLTVVTTARQALAELVAPVMAATMLVGLLGQLGQEEAVAAAHALKRQALLRAVTEPPVSF
ncbi:MAG: hypothetical protein CMK81_00085 [Pseudomonadales bacterium]|nr:hypothetical protein [Pseudomonadales bacterium]